MFVLEQMLQPEDMPGVDVFVPTYSGGCNICQHSYVLSVYGKFVLEQMLQPEDMPGVDVFVPTYSGGGRM
jgi:hypothetical protein